MSFFNELKERNVFKVGAIYAVTAWLLAQVAGLALPTFDAPEWVLRVFLFFLLLGFPLALILAWALELTPEGIKRAEVSVGEKRMWTITAVLAVLAVGWLQYGAPAMKQGVVADDASVAVLPFVNMSGVADNEYFSDGLTETLLHKLAQVNELKVAARTSSFAFKGKDVDIREIARILGVAHVLEGSVQRSDNRIRVTAQLINAEDGSHIWSENFDRTLDDIFSIQDEIAREVAARLTSELLAEQVVEDTGTDNPQAYDLYLRGLDQLLQHSFESLKNAEGLFRSALLIDPGYVDARRDLARTLWRQWETGLVDIEGYREAMTIVDALLESHPGDALARSYQLTFPLREKTETGVDYSWSDIVDDLEQLAARAPNEPQIWMSLGSAYAQSGDKIRAEAMFDRALALNPLDARIYDLKSIFLMRSIENRFNPDPDLIEEAFEYRRKAVELNPANASMRVRLCTMEFDYGSFEAALEACYQAYLADPSDPEIIESLADKIRLVNAMEELRVLEDMAREMDPEAPASYAISMRRMIMARDWEAGADLGEKILRSDIRDRRGIIGDAIRTYSLSMKMLDREDDALAFLAERFPSIDPYSTVGGPDGDNFQRYEGTVRTAHLVLNYQHAEATSWEKFAAPYRHYIETYIDRDDPTSFVLQRSMLGMDEDKMIEFMTMESPYRIACILDLDQLLEYPQFAHLAEVPAVQERLALILDMKARMRQQTSDFFRDKGLIE